MFLRSMRHTARGLSLSRVQVRAMASNPRNTIVIVGAGIVGLNTAYQLSRRIDKTATRVVVLEKGTSLGEGSTGASSAICRFLYSKDEMITMAREGWHAYNNWGDYLQTKTPGGTFTNTGVLWAMESREAATKSAGRLQSFGCQAEILDNEGVKRKFPYLETMQLELDMTGETEVDFDGEEDENQAYLYEPEGGYFEPVSALTDLRDACVRDGVEIRMASRVASVQQAGGSVTGVTLEDGTTYASNTVLSASGPWCNELLAMAGVELPLTFDPVRIQVAYKKASEIIDPSHVSKVPAVMMKVDGAYFRPQVQQQQMIISTVREEDELDTQHNPDLLERSCDVDVRQKYLNSYHMRFPTAEARGAVSGISGMYTVCREDVHPAIGETNLKGFWVANGFSGHGFKIGPMTGSLLAQAMTGKTLDTYDSKVPIDFFSPYRSPIVVENMSVLA